MFQMTGEDNRYQGNCPMCSSGTLVTTKATTGRWRIECLNGCKSSDVLDIARHSKKVSGNVFTANPQEPLESELLGHDVPHEEEAFDERRPPDPSWEASTRAGELRIGAKQLEQLATDLGVSDEALKYLRVGWSPMEGGYTLPEVDSKGVAIGLCVRSTDGKKVMVEGSKRGIYLPANWKEAKGPILVPEGASDVAAALTMNLTAIGRSSATGGKRILVSLLKDLPEDRDIVILGEMDARSNGNWLGKEAAVKLAEYLAKELDRPVYWALPPEGKDLREYLQRRSKGTNALARGKQLLLAIAERRNKVEPVADRFRIEAVNAVRLLAEPVRQTWLVEHALVQGQPAMMGGPPKSLKTTLASDLAISLATGWNFLGYEKFRVRKKQRVCMLSGESGAATIQRTIKAQLEAKQRFSADRLSKSNDLLANLFVGFTLPKFGVQESVAALEAFLDEGKFDVLFIDPLYLCLLSGDANAQASSLFDMGPRLLEIATICLKRAVTPILLHHFTKSKSQAQHGKWLPPELGDLSFGGVTEFARQWLLLSRREAYDDGQGLQKLYMRLGGSAGFSSLWALDVDQGTLNTDFEGQKWNVEIRTYLDQKRVDLDAKELEEMQKAADRKTAERNAVLNSLRGSADGKTQTLIVEETKLATARIREVLSNLVEIGQITKTEVKNSQNKMVTRYSLPVPPTVNVLEEETASAPNPAPSSPRRRKAKVQKKRQLPR